MSLLNVAAKQLTRIYQTTGNRMLFVGCTHRTDKIIDRDDDPSIIIPIYQEKVGESLDVKKARLLYQSRKRGMLENGLLLSTFAAKYLDTMSEEQTAIYDKLINVPSNDWEIFYWAAEVKPTPKEYDTEIMDLLKSHVRNEKKESRIKQPDLYT